MTTFDILQKAGADKLVRLAIPVEEANQAYHLVVMVEPAVPGLTPSPPTRTWPPGFFENTAGKWIGELERPQQGQFETREEL